MLNKDIISNLTLKMKDEESSYNKLGEKYDAETDIEKKNELVDKMLIVKTNYEVIRADLKRYFDACLSYRKAMEASYPKDQLVELFVRIKRYENYLNDKYKMNLKYNDVDKNKAEVLFVLEEGKEVGFALYFHNFSTFLGRAGIHLEDLFVLPEYRGKGYGKAILKKLAQLTVQRGSGRLEWCCSDWNTPSINFYESLKAKPLSEWMIFRVTGDTLNELAK